MVTLPAGRKLSHLSDVGGLGGLAAGVGVDLGVKDEDVHVVAGGKHVVEAAEADVIRPAVAAEDPEGLLGEVGLVGENRLGGVAVGLLELGDVGGSGGLAGLGVRAGLEPGGRSLLQGVGRAVGLEELLGLGDDLLLDGVIAKGETQAVLGVVLEEGVVPRRTVAAGVDVERRRGGRVAPDRGAAGGVGDEHAVTADLRDETCVRGLGAAGAGAGELEVRLARTGCP